MEGKVRVLVVDDSAMLAETYCALLEREPGMACVGVLTSAAGLEEAVTRERPDVVVLDLTMPGPNPLDAVRALGERHPDVRVLAFSGHDDAQTEARAFDAGAWGLVSKHGDPRDVVRGVREVMEGRTVFQSFR